MYIRLIMFVVRSWDGTAVRELASHQRGLGGILAQCHMWVFLRFSSLHKNQHSKFQFNQDRGSPFKPAKTYVASSPNIVNNVTSSFLHYFLRSLHQLKLQLLHLLGTGKLFHSFLFVGVHRTITSPFPNPVNKREF